MTKIKTELVQNLKTNSAATTAHSGPLVINDDLEHQDYVWINARRELEIDVSTAKVIAKSLAIDSMFKKRNSIFYWAYFYRTRWRLSYLVAIRTGQKSSGHRHYIRKEFVHEPMHKFI